MKLLLINCKWLAKVMLSDKRKMGLSLGVRDIRILDEIYIPKKLEKLEDQGTLILTKFVTAKRQFLNSPAKVHLKSSK